jgi:predicted extracellular nuclease
VSPTTRSIRTRFQPRSLVVLLVALLMAIGVVQFGSFSRAHSSAAFTPGNLVIYRVGDGSAALASSATAVFLDEYTTSGGSPVQSIAMPTTVNGSNKRLTASGTATSEGLMTLSTDGQYLTATGYDAALGTASITTSASSTVNRVIARVDSGGTVDTTTALTDISASNAGNPRSVISTNGTDLWMDGSVGGIRYTTLGATTSTQLSTTVTNLRQTNIFGGQLYVSDSSGTAVRLGTVGSGTPTTSGQTITNLPGFPTTGSPYGFFFADLDSGVAGLDTLYVADDTANVIQKFSLVSGTWTANGTKALATVRGLTGVASGSSVTLYVTNGSTLQTLTDTSGYNATITGTLTSIATAGANTAFRGVAFAPSSGSPTPTPTPTGTPTATPTPTPTPTPVAIHDIQGNGNTSPLSGSVTTTGIVTGLRSNGFFIQEPDATVDADPNTSEGIFVFTSSAPPAAAVVGNLVQVAGTISEFIPSADPFSPSQTELTSPTVSLLSSGNPLPTPHTITAGETQVNDYNNLEKYEGMRVSVPSLTAISGTQGTVTESSATSVSTGIFYGVIIGVPRPFREPGIELPDTVPTPYPSGAAPANVPRFDFNPERLRVNSKALGGAAIDVTSVGSGATITNITGPLDYGFRTYTIDVDPPSVTPAPSVSGVGSAVPVPTPTATELTIASFNMERFFDTTNDPATSDVVLTQAAFDGRLNKASLAIRNVLNSPDVIGVEEMEAGLSVDNSILQAVADKVNTDAGTPNDYQAYLARGNDPGGINVGFLVRSSRVAVFTVTQYNKNEQWVDPTDSVSKNLNDRPPLVLRATIPQVGGTFSFTVIANHLRSLNGVDDLTSAHTRVKKQKEAESLATLIHSFETNGDPNQVAPYDNNIVSLGDYNAFEFNDGYCDVVGTVLGAPAPADQVVQPTATISTNMFDLIGFVTTSQKYSYSFDGDAQAIDHELVNRSMLARFTRLAYGRMDADFPEAFRNDTNRPERLSDHDPSVAYFDLILAPTAANGSISGRITDNGGAPVAGAVINVSGTQNRKTITDANGNYHFDNVETNGFYTVTPSRANYVFSPANRSLSQVGSKTEAVFSASSTGDAANPLDLAEYFVRQQYVDLLGREPDEGGFNYWSDQINQCGGDSGCVSAQRRDVAAAFFIEREFQQTGSFIYDMYAGALGRKPAFAEYSADRQQVIGGPTLEAEKTTFAQSFVQRAEFVQKYQANTRADSFVDALIQNAQTSGVDLSSERASLINAYNGAGSTIESRASVMRAIADNATFKQAQYNPAFVLTEYFAYLRRDVDQGGYDFWLNVLNNGDPGNYRGMVCSFVTSTEYQRRFSAVVSHSNSECGR